MNLRISEAPEVRVGRARIRFMHMRRGTPALASPTVGISLMPDGPVIEDERAWSEFRAATGFLIDSTIAAVAPDDLARMIACLFFALSTGCRHKRVEVMIGDGKALNATARLLRPEFAVEANGFGAVHILHELDALGLYVLEMAPAATIPAHFHRVMEESEMVLDAGILQQNLRVRPGDAFTWPAGYVHEYRNLTNRPKRILCIDRPKFIPEDEVLVTGAPHLVPMRPQCNYFC